MTGYRSLSFDLLVGRKVLVVDGSSLYLDTGAAFRIDLDGNCCSSSDFTPEGLAGFNELLGATILAVEERDGKSKEELDYPEGDVVSWHFLVFTTDKGHVTIDWRNDSNGYYDGEVLLLRIEPLPPVVHDALLDGRPDAILLAVQP